MEKLFVERGEIKKDMFENNSAFPYLYNKVLDVIQNGGLKVDHIEIRQLYVVDFDNKRVVPAIINGYSVSVFFGDYDEKNRQVGDRDLYYQAIDKECNVYNEEHYPMFESETDAQDLLQDMIETWGDE